MEKGKWNSVEHYQTTYWSRDLTGEDGNTKILIAQSREGGDKFPYLLIFSENINSDHWWGGRRRWGHGHQIKFDSFYFDPSGNGNYIAGEELRWMPHYGDNTQVKKESLGLEEDVKAALAELPVRDNFSGAVSNLPAISVSDPRLVEVAGVPFELLFEHYQDPSFLAEGRNALIEKYRKIHEETERFCMFGQRKEEKPYEPEIDLSGPFPIDKIHYLLNFIKVVSGFDIHAQPEQLGNSLEGAMMGIHGIAEFPGPVDFMDGSDKSDDVGRPGNTGLVDLSREAKETSRIGVGRYFLGFKSETHNVPRPAGGLETHNLPRSSGGSNSGHSISGVDISTFDMSEFYRKFRKYDVTNIPRDINAQPEKEDSDEKGQEEKKE
jgi:hypothetical protein